MIVSVSRRTDIPAYYGEWFINRLKEKYVLVRNPFNPSSVSRIRLHENEIDCIVFWTKNPVSFIRWLPLIRFPYYFLFTITGYGKNLEKSMPDKQMLIDAFIQLSSICGRERVIWRYDPIVLSSEFSIDWHIRNFSFLAEQLHLHTVKCIFSFLHLYAKCQTRLKKTGVKEITEKEKISLACEMAKIACAWDIVLESCASGTDLSMFGIRKGSCINKAVIENITGVSLETGKDKYQRKHCGCIESIDIGAYDTCPGNCLYCYANIGFDKVRRNYEDHDPESPLLSGHLQKRDRIFERN
ncbi:MAG: DUF1848 domain-containing protein [Bacteroidales bacterium]|nr:DUF1848 domain-containing protein [Bacteroidales bacterium]